MKDLKILFYDIETLPLGFDGFSCGKQFVRHNQLQPNRDVYDIITIQYKWNTNKKVHNLSWIGKDKDSSNIIKQFDEEVKKADILIGKNSDKFDSRHINTLRLIHDLPPLPDWGMPKTRDDVEKQIRRFFYLPSYSLDYLSKLLLDSGKDKMEFADWLKIRNYKELLELHKKSMPYKALNEMCIFYYGLPIKKVISEGKAALYKMIKYGNKDVLDTQKCWDRIEPYVKPKLNKAHFYGNKDGNYLRCKKCGGDNIHKNGKDYRYSVPKQKFYCMDCKSEAGKATILKSGGFGKIE